jgi:KUP system potassium uptake protein
MHGPDSPDADAPEWSRKRFLGLSLAALGIVFGDIGTSPLYAMRESLNPAHGVELNDASILGVLSLITWSLLLVVTVKYLVFVLRADNEGEGGILALMALIQPKTARRRGAAAVFVVLGLFGAALLYGDGIITPAISVLGAMEGVGIAAPALTPMIIPLTLGVIVGLFLIQRHGTAAVGRLFGPITLVWFVVLGILGVRGILLAPRVLWALSPHHGVAFLATHGLIGLIVLGSVFLVVTGAEALYADMGHFGRGPIRLTWLAIVLPSLLLNYFGQGGLLLSSPGALENPFYLLAPGWALVPLIVLATLATIIASQAIISGAFSLTMQAVSLGYWPRLEIRHTSAEEMGQIYVPVVNWLLMLGTVWIVLSFRTSSALASAYGIAVTSTMVITSILFFAVATRRWGWDRRWAGGANIVKVLTGGYVPLLLAAAIFVVMVTWRDGREVLGARLREKGMPLSTLLADVASKGYARVRGNAIYMTSDPTTAPPALVKNLEHNRALHMQVVLMSILTEDVPHVRRHERVSVETVGAGAYRVVARFGFMDEPDAMDVLLLMREHGIHLKPRETTFFLGRERIISTKRPGLMRWRELLFGWLSMNARQATAYFGIPPDRVIEVGSQVEI